MNRLLRFWMTGMVIVILLAGALATAALADDQPAATGYGNVQLWVDPEYDDPSLLVMIQGTVLGATPPATVQFLVPSAAVLYSAGSIDASGQYAGGPPTRVASDIPGWDKISYTATTTTFRVEYYDDIIQGQPDKTVDYEFMSYLPISGLDVSIQQPLKATDFTVDPAGAASTDQQGFNIQTYSYDTVEPASPLTFNISYYKTDSNPSVQQNTAGGTAPATSGGGGISNGWLAFIIIVAVIIVVSLVFFLARRSRTVSRADRRRRAGVPKRSPVGSRNAGGGGARAAGAARPASKGSGSGARFCTNCGAPFDANAKFCRQCGAPRR